MKQHIFSMLVASYAIVLLNSCKKEDLQNTQATNNNTNQTIALSKSAEETYYTNYSIYDASGNSVTLSSEILNNENAVFVGVASNDSTIDIIYFPSQNDAISYCAGNGDLEYVATKLSQINAVRNFAADHEVNFDSDEEPNETVRQYMDSVFGSAKTTSAGIMWEHITTTINNQNQTVFTGGGSTMGLTQAAQYSFFGFRNKASLVWQVGWNTLCDYRWWGGQKFFCFGAGYVPLGGPASAGPNFFNDRAESGF